MPAQTVDRQNLQAALDVVDELHLDWIDVGDLVHKATSECEPIQSAAVSDQVSYLIERWGFDQVVCELRSMVSVN